MRYSSMTVGQLIELLGQYPAERRVRLSGDEEGNTLLPVLCTAEEQVRGTTMVVLFPRGRA